MDSSRWSSRIIRNNIIREGANIKENIVDEIERRQLIWYGHMNRMDNNGRLKRILECTSLIEEGAVDSVGHGEREFRMLKRNQRRWLPE